ncbi:MAG: hypothetical protein K6G72_05485 [Lachnospiraceae bacterium]|nr:hypothetical protein [Lachnospiraceae bacterium]
MKIRKKLLVWGAFVAMAFIIAGCEEESHFDSVVKVEETSSEGLGDGSGDSVGNVHVVKNNVGEAVSDLFFGGDKEEEQEAISEEVSEEIVSEEAAQEEPVVSETEVTQPEAPDEDSTTTDDAGAGSVGEPATVEEDTGKIKVSDKEASLNDKLKKEETEKAPDTEVVKEETEKAPDTEVVKEETPQIVEEEKSVDLDITVLIINEAKIKLGMVAIMDPYTGEQVSIGAIDNEEMLIFDMKWPSKEKKLKIGCYDESGKLIKEESLDFSLVSKGCIITFIGEGKIEHVECEIE